MGWRAALRRALAPPPAPPADDAALSRRALLGGAFLRRAVTAAAAPMIDRAEAAAATVERLERPAPARTPRAVPVLRPPGALAEAAFLAGCTRCMDCASACPHGAVVPAPLRLRAAAGTPMVDPAQQPCLMCADTPCITACGPRVLRRDAGQPRMGSARIQVLDCLAHQGSTCSSCAERCPVPGAIRLERGRPVIDAAVCTGCGVCQHVCPAPRNAVIVLPGREPA